MPSPFITLDSVSIRLRDQILFSELYWAIRDDQHWAVIGPNGSGKSTLMKALCGSLPVVKGKITYHFLRDAKHTAPQDHVAYVTFDSQRAVLGDEAFYQERWNIGVNEDTLTVSEFLSEENIQRVSAFQIAAVEHDASFAKRRQDAIDWLELNKLLDRSVVQLSNGERRKVTIARALLKQPKLLILDNPFAGLDERFRGKLAQNLDNLMQSTMRVIVVGTSRDEIPASVTNVLNLSLRGAVCATKQSPIRQSDAHAASQRTLAMTTARLRQNASHDPSRPILAEMKNVNVSYNGTPILRDVDWTIREGEHWALLGPNGAGKTTLLSLILADNPQAYANDITLFGKRRGTGESIWEIKQHIGWVAPELQLYYPRDATCLDVVCSGWFDSVGLYHQCSPQQREIAIAWLEKFGLGEQIASIFDQLAEGEQRLTLLARALVKNPPLLILDEPCQGLDEHNRDLILQAIDSSMNQKSTSMIYVTHRADEMPQSITHVLRLSEGKIVN